MGEKYLYFQMDSIPVLKEGAELWFLDVVDGNIVVCKDTVGSICVVSDIESNRRKKSVVEYRLKNYTDKLIHSDEIGEKYFLSRHDLSYAIRELAAQTDPHEDLSVILFTALIKSKEDSKGL